MAKQCSSAAIAVGKERAGDVRCSRFERVVRIAVDLACDQLEGFASFRMPPKAVVSHDPRIDEAPSREAKDVRLSVGAFRGRVVGRGET